jgi:hypothetical protein
VAITGDVGARSAFFAAARFYLVRHPTGSRCEDALELWGGRVPARLAMTQIPLISAEEQKPSRVEGKLQLFHYWRTTVGAQLKDDLTRLRYGKEEQADGTKSTANTDSLLNS